MEKNIHNMKIKILNEKVKEYGLPAYATNGSAGMDLCACIDEPITLQPNERKLIGTGLAMHIEDPNLVGLVFARSGLASKRGLALSNSVAVIDSDYVNELKVAMINLSNEPQTINPGDRIAQYVLMPILNINWIITDELEYTDRSGGFGSTGVGNKI